MTPTLSVSSADGVVVLTVNRPDSTWTQILLDPSGARLLIDRIGEELATIDTPSKSATAEARALIARAARPA